MKKTSEKIVFFGSGPVAAKSLELLAQDFDIEAVITKPATLKEMSAITNAPIYALASKSELDELIAAKKFSSSVSVLIDFGIIVSQEVINAFRLGIVNSHFSLLPQLRGADPITFAILSGQKTTGVSLMLLVEAMDEGPLLAQSELTIGENATTPQLTDELIELSHHMLRHTLPLYVSGEVQPVSQEKVTIADSAVPTYSRKLTKADGKIDWTKSAEQIEREIRAYLGWPGSWGKLGSQDVIIIKAKTTNKEGRPGQLIIEGKELTICCGQGALQIQRLKPAGKKEMPVEAFLAGYKSRIIS